MKNLTFNEFCDVLGKMSNDEFCSFITYYHESNGNETMLMPIGFNEMGFIEWIGRFTEDGEPNNDECKYIIENILKNACHYDYVLIELCSSNSKTSFKFFTKYNLKETMFKYVIIQMIYNDKSAWGDKYNENGTTNDLYTMFSKYSNRCDFIAGIFFIRDNESVDVDKLLIAEPNVSREYVKYFDENLCTLENIGIADSFHYLMTESTVTFFVKNEMDYKRINALPFYKGHVKMVKDWEEQ